VDGHPAHLHIVELPIEITLQQASDLATGHEIGNSLPEPLRGAHGITPRGARPAVTSRPRTFFLARWSRLITVPIGTPGMTDEG